MLKRTCYLTAFVVSTIVASIASAAEEGFVSIFNGKDMTGWEARPGFWHVEDGCLTAQSMAEKPCKQQFYLFWRGGAVKDFELRLEYKLVGGNSGVQFRTTEIPGWEVAGYQADMEAGTTWTGALFEVRGRGGVVFRGEKSVIDPDGTKHVTPLGDPVELYKHVKPGEWNEYAITAKGNEITLAINGVVMSQVADNYAKKAADGGLIALQMHPGPPMKIQFRNIRLKELD